MNALLRVSRAVSVALCAALVGAAVPQEAYAQLRSVPRVAAPVTPAFRPGSVSVPSLSPAVALPAASLGVAPALSPAAAPDPSRVPVVDPAPEPVVDRPGALTAPSAAASPARAAALAPAAAAPSRAAAALAPESPAAADAPEGAAFRAEASASAVADAPAIARGFAALRRAFSTRRAETLAAADAPAAGAAAKAAAPLAPASRLAAADDGRKAPPAPPATPEQPSQPEGGKTGLGRSALWFIGALLVAQVGVEALGNAMPVVAQRVFGDFTVVAQLAVFSSIAGILGRQFGPLIVQRFGLRKTYLFTEVARMVSISTLLGLLLTGHMTIPLMMAFYSLNGLLGGVAVTAETSIPPALVGQDQAKLEKFWTWEQTLLEIVGVLGPILAGYAVDAYGAGPTLAAFPISFLLAFFILFFTLRIPSRIESMRIVDLKNASEKGTDPAAAHDNVASLKQGLKTLLGAGALGLAAMAFTGAPLLGWALAVAAMAGAALWLARASRLAKLTEPATLQSRVNVAENVLGGFFRKLARGAKVVWKNPLLKYSFLAYTAYMLLNPFLYSMIGPAFGRLVAGPEGMGAVFGLVAGLYSAGGLLGGLLMMREQRAINKAKESGSLTPEQEDAQLRASMRKWMYWTIPTLLAFGTMALGLPTLGAAFALPAWLAWAAPLTLSAVALIPFGVAQVISMVKLRSFFQSKVPNASDMADAMGFLGSASLAASTVGILGLKFLFQHAAGTLPFLLIAAAMLPIGAYYWYITRKLDKVAASAPPSNPAPPAGH